MDFIATVQFRENGARGNPVSIFMEQQEGECRIIFRLPQWKHIVGVGATANKAAANFETKLKAALPLENAYEGPYWNGGIKPEKPAPPKPVTATAPAAKPAAPPPTAEPATTPDVTPAVPAAPPAPPIAGGGPADTPPAPTSGPAPSS